MKRRMIDRTLPLLLLAVALLVYNVRLGSYGQFHGDETSWIFAGKLYTDLFFLDRDFEHPMWDEQLGSWGNLNPPAGKYLIGTSLNLFLRLPVFVPPPRASWGRAEQQGLTPAALTVQRLERELGFHHLYGFAYDFESNRADQRVPSPEMLAAARRGPVLVALLGAAALWAIARRLWGAGVGLTVLALYLCNPMVIRTGRQAMVDMPAVSLAMIALWATLHAVRPAAGEATARRGVYALWIVGAGLLWGVALATKFNVLAPWLATLGGVAAWAVWTLARPVHAAERAEQTDLKPGAKEGLGVLIAIALLPPLVFFALNPFLYHEAFAAYGRHPNKLDFMLHLGKMLGDYSAETRLDHVGARLAAAWRFLVHDAAWGAGVLGVWVGVVMGIGFFAGLTGLWGYCLRTSDPILRRPRILFLAVQTATCLAVVAWVPQDWDRLFLPLVPLLCVALGFGLCRVCGMLFQGRKSVPAASPSASLP